MSVIEFIMALLAGVALGALFYGGLLYTVRRFPTWKYPRNALFFSFLLRSTLILGGFYLIVQWQPMGLFLALVSFFLTRIYYTRVQAKTLSAHPLHPKS
jgi:F1F0 ATPase subunit 2